MGKMAKEPLEKKSAQALKIAKSSGKEKKKWTQGKQKETISRLCTVTDELLEKIQKEIVNQKIITKTNLTEKYNLNLYSSVRLLRYFEENGIINKISGGRKLNIYCGPKHFKKEIIEEVIPENGN